MKRILVQVIWQLCLMPGTCVFADLVTLKDGGQMSGLVETGTQWEIRVKLLDSSRTIPIDQIQSIQFDGTPAVTTSAEPARIDPQGITIPVGTEIAIRTIDRLDSKTADLYKEYAASLDDPVVVDGVTVVPVNSNAILRVTDARNPKMSRASLSITVIAVVVNGQRIKVETGNVDSQSGSRAKRTLTGAAVGAGTGAAIGAAAGGGLGAGIGAVAGGGLGAGIGNVMGRKPAEIPSETRFTYKLTQPVVLNDQGGAR